VWTERLGVRVNDSRRLIWTAGVRRVYRVGYVTHLLGTLPRPGEQVKIDGLLGYLFPTPTTRRVEEAEIQEVASRLFSPGHESMEPVKVEYSGQLL